MTGSLFALLFAVNSFTFNVTATGVEKGTPLEFLFAGKNSDRDYETMFLLEDSIIDFCRRLERAGLPRGRPTDIRKCRLWPVGCSLKLEPKLDDFVKTDLPDGMRFGEIIYTGGARDEADVPVAETNMPAAVFSLYTLSQSPLLFNGLYEQSLVYGCSTAAKTLKKGERMTFTLSWDVPKLAEKLEVSFQPGNSLSVLKSIKDKSEHSDIELSVRFDDQLTVGEAVAVANALAVLDSPRIKINGHPDNDFFFRAFLPLVKWRDRKERLVQPFEVSIHGNEDKLTFIEEDWSGEGTDPKLTPHEISFEKAKSHGQIDTCFIFAAKDTAIGRIRPIIGKMPKSVINYYVYEE